MNSSRFAAGQLVTWLVLLSLLPGQLVLGAAANAREEGVAMRGIDRFEGTAWEGSSELWTDPLGNEAHHSDASLEFAAGEIHYRWAYGGEAQVGVFRPADGGLLWQDSWHQPERVLCRNAATDRGLFGVEYSYPAGEGEDWSWRILLSQRPDGTLVLQMTNITPWGEEGRAVRMTLREKTGGDR